MKRKESAIVLKGGVSNTANRKKLRPGGRDAVRNSIAASQPYENVTEGIFLPETGNLGLIRYIFISDSKTPSLWEPELPTGFDIRDRLCNSFRLCYCQGYVVLV